MRTACILGFTLVCAWLGASAAPSAKENDKKPAKDEPIEIVGQIVANDLPDRRRNFPCKIHAFKLSKDKLYVIDLMSKEFDTYLRIEDSAGKNLAEDDDGGEGLNSRLRFTPPKDDTYQIIATSFSGGVGMYTLKLRVADPREAKK